jgi:predicted membrane protein
MSKSEKVHSSVMFLLITFLYGIFSTSSMDSTSELNSAFLYSHIAFLQKYIFLIILALFANFEVKPGQIGSKKQKKHIFVNVEDGQERLFLSFDSSITILRSNPAVSFPWI